MNRWTLETNIGDIWIWRVKILTHCMRQYIMQNNNDNTENHYFITIKPMLLKVYGGIRISESSAQYLSYHEAFSKRLAPYWWSNKIRVTI